MSNRWSKWLLLASIAACGEEVAGPDSVSPATSVISVSPTGVESGSTASLTLQARDMNGKSVRVSGLDVRFSASGGTSQGVIDPIPAVDNGDGTYSSTFTGTKSGTPTTIEATVNGVLVTSPSTITVLPGQVSTATSFIGVSKKRIDVGLTSTITLYATDAAGNQQNRGGFNVAFTAGGGTSTGTISATKDNGDGIYTATFTGTGIGSATTIHATINGDSVTSEAPTITVAAGDLSTGRSSVTASADTIAAGAAATLTLVTRDSQGNELSGGGHNVVFLVSDASIGAIDTTTDTSSTARNGTTDWDDGTYSATLNAFRAGTLAISAAIDGDTVTSPPTTITVLSVPVSPQRSSIAVSRDSIVAGDTLTLTLRTRDADSTDFTGGGLDVEFTLGDTLAGVLDTTVDHGDGTYTTIFTGLQSVITTTIGATIDDSLVVEMLDSNSVSHLPTVTVMPGPASIASSEVTVSDQVLGLGETSTLLLRTRDALGNDLVSGGHQVEFTQSGGTTAGTITPSPARDNGDGTYAATFVATVVGTPTTIGATIDGAAVPDDDLPMITVGCSPGIVSLETSTVTVFDNTIPSGVATTITLQVRDSLGNCLTNDDLVVTFSTSTGPDQGTGIIGTTVNNGDGSYSATFTGAIAGNPTTIETLIDGEIVTSPAPTITVTPGDISVETSEVISSDSLIEIDVSATLTLQARDAAGNDLVSGGATVSFTASGGTSQGLIDPVPAVDNGNGSYTASFTGQSVGTPTNISASVSGNPLMRTAPAIEVGVHSVGTSLITVNGGTTETVQAGDVVTLELRVRDDQDRDINGSGHVVEFTQSGPSTGTISAVTDNGDGTYTATFTGDVAGSATTIGATINNQSVTSTPPTITVEPGEASTSASVVNVSDVTVTVGATVTLTLEARDAFGNPLTTGGLDVAFTASGGAGVSAGDISATTDNGDGTYTATFMGTVAGTATTIGATMNGEAVTSELPEITVQN